MRTLRRRLMTSYANLDLPVRWKDSEVAKWATSQGITTRRQAMAYTNRTGLSFDGNTKLRAFPELDWFAKWDGWTMGQARSFADCANLTEVTLPSVARYISYQFFINCKSLTKLRLPDTIEAIETYAFCGCTSLTLDKLPKSLTNIARYAFQGCSNITLSSLPEGLETLGSSTFNGCTSITEMTLPDTLTLIDHMAFGDCANLAKVTMPTSGKLKEIGVAAFYNCGKLVLTSLPEGLESIGSRAFDGCTSITEMTFPSSLTSLSGAVFYPTNAVKRLRFLGATPPTTDGNGWALPQVPTYVPDDALDAYKTAWKDNSNVGYLKPLSEWKDE